MNEPVRTRKTCWFLTCGYVDVIKRRVLQRHVSGLAAQRERDGWVLATDFMSHSIDGVHWPGRPPQQYSLTSWGMFGGFNSHEPNSDYAYIFCNESVKKQRAARDAFTTWADAQDPPYPYEVISL